MSTPEQLSEWGWDNTEGNNLLVNVLLSEQELQHESKFDLLNKRIAEIEETCGGKSYHEAIFPRGIMRVLIERVDRIQEQDYLRVLINSEKEDGYDGVELCVFEFTVDPFARVITCDVDSDTTCGQENGYLELEDIRVPYFMLEDGSVREDVGANYRRPEPAPVSHRNTLKAYDYIEAQREDCQLLMDLLIPINQETCIPIEC